MMTNVFENRLRINAALWYGLIGLGAACAGYFLASAPLRLILAFCGLAWLLTLPYHAKLSVILAVATFSSALIVPFFPGRPYVWEFAALLAWSGLLVLLSMRRHAPDYMAQLGEHRWLFLGAAGYCLTLIVTMYYRGFGLRIFGGEQMGGRFYLQQLACAVFPVLFILVRFEERMLVRLFVLQCFLATTFLISDFALSIAPQPLLALLRFFELAGDAVNFENQAMNFGIRRLQSLAAVGQGFFFILLVCYNIRDFVGRRGLWLVPLALSILGIGLPSGHRWLWLVVGLTLVFSAYAQRFYSIGRMLIATALLSVVVPSIYIFADRMPLSAQRSVSFLPGIEISEQARLDGYGTMEMRRALREAGRELVPSYFWMGRGFGQAAHEYSSLWDPTGFTAHLRMGRFYNGFIGLLVNTGVFGTGFMMMFLGAGTILAWKIILLLRAHGCEDSFARTCSVISGMWMANTLGFLFLHGDSEWAMKSFSLQAGMLLACHYHLRRRLSVVAT